VLGVTACETCGYDLTRTPMANLEAIPAKDWTGIVKGSCLYAEAGFTVPEGADCELLNCNADNVRVPVGVKITGGCHRLIKQQNDRGDWSCDWTSEAPVEPLDKMRRLIEGLNVDPAEIPAKRLTDEEVKVTDERIADEQELADAEEKVTELTAKLALSVEAPIVKEVTR